MANSTIDAVPITPPAEKTRIFFPNLDALRFFAFLLVFFAHIFATDYTYIKQAPWYLLFKRRLFLGGDLGVSFFFVLSGFLITYLLLKEKELTANISVRSFYIRRALRIWPLYYFTVFFGFVIFPLLKSYFGKIPNETADPVLCSLFLNNFNAIINGPPDSSVLSVLWSVAIEEQFYLVWPVLFWLVPEKYYRYIFFGVIMTSVLFRASNLKLGNWLETHSLGVISDMAIGGLGAYLSLRSKKFISAIESSNKYLNIVPYLAFLIFIGFRFQIFSIPVLIVFKRIIMAFFFCWIILEQNFCNRSLFKLSRLKTISKLGKYTYGLYCLHGIAGLIVLIVLEKLGLNKTSLQLWLIELPVTMALSILISYISYTYFESKFLKLKDRFALIVKS